MNRLLAILVLAVVALVVPTGATATHDLQELQSAVDALNQVDPTIVPLSGGGRDFVVGGGRLQGNQTLAVSARSSPVGEDVQGHLSFIVAPGVAIIVELTCLSVIENVAAVGGTVTQSQLSEFEGKPVFATFLDSGLPGGEGDAGFLSGMSFSVFPPELCSLAHFFPAFVPLVGGNFVVHDEPAE